LLGRVRWAGGDVTGLTIRPIETMAEIEKCLDLQRTTWAMPDVDITPARLFVIAQHAIVPPLGAFEPGGRLVAFVHTLYGKFEGVTCFYSHMLAVEERLRNSGIGLKLKLAQREQALEARVPLVVWTFDPLQSRNAHFNLNKLGAVARRYVENFYGEQHTTVFDAGIGSDRLFAEWWVDSPRVARAIKGEAQLPTGQFSFVEIPEEIGTIKRTDHHSALLWRLRVRERMQSLLSRGLVAVALQRGSSERVSRYIFGEEAVAGDATR
jgi:predicted GNAT superfamily acetyltransferase